MKKLLTLAAALALTGAITGVALAGSWTLLKSVHLNAQRPSTAFSVRIRQPKKILLYIGSAKVSTTTRCIKGTTASKLSRSFATDGTRNLLWHIPARQDVCHISVSATVKGQNTGYVSVQAMRRS
jgi:hypothetical protein